VVAGEGRERPGALSVSSALGCYHVLLAIASYFWDQPEV